MAFLTAQYYSSSSGANWILVERHVDTQYRHAVANMATLVFHPPYVRTITTYVYEARFLSSSEASNLMAEPVTIHGTQYRTVSNTTVSFSKQRSGEAGAYNVTCQITTTGDWRAAPQPE